MTNDSKNQFFKIAFYIRVSTEEQAESPEGSLRSQEQRLHEAVNYKNRHGNFGEVKGIFIDPGISAKDMKRPKLQELLCAIRNREIDLVMVTELSRLSRNTRDFIEMWDMMRANECRFLSLREDFDTTNAAGELVLFQLMNLAQFERRQTAERVEANIAARSARGLYNGGVVPLGYKTNPDKPGYLEIDPEGSQTVIAAFDALRKFESLSRAALWLNDNGLKPRKVVQGGGRFTRLAHFSVDNLHCLLRNKAYIGVKVYFHRGERRESQAVWQPIIDQSLFNSVQKILDRNHRRFKPERQNRLSYILSGVVYCKHCRDVMVGKSAHGNAGKVGYYEHSWSTKRDSTLSKKVFSCNPHRVLSKLLEPLVWNKLMQFMTDPAFVRAVLERSKITARENPQKVERDRVKAKLAGVASQIEGLAERISELPKGLSAGPLYKQMQKLEDAKKDLEATLLSLGVDGSKSARRIIDAPSLEAFQTRYRQFLKTEITEKQKRQLIRKFIHKVEVSMTDVTIQFLVDKEHYEAEAAADTAVGQGGKIIGFGGSNTLTYGPQDWT